MLTIGRQYSSIAKYQKDDYYAVSAGSWYGKTADRLGLCGEILPGQFAEIRRGVFNGEQLVRKGGVNHKHGVGFDVQFAMGKDLSMLREFGPPEVRNAIDRAWDKSIYCTLDKSAEYIQARVTMGGKTSLENTGNALWGVFNHETSRALDMQRHTHCTLMNITCHEEARKYRAIEVYNAQDRASGLWNNQKFLGQFQRNEFAANLLKEFQEIGLALDIRSDEKGLIHTDLFSAAEKAEFSRRTQQINVAIADLRIKYPDAPTARLREIACIGTRSVKRQVDMTAVRESWLERAKTHGIDSGEIQERLARMTEKVRSVQDSRSLPSDSAYDRVRQATRIVTEYESAFTKEKVLDIAGKLSIGEYSMTELDSAFKELQSDEIQRKKDEPQKYTTVEMQKLEKGIIRSIRAGQGQVGQILDNNRIAEALSGYENLKRVTFPGFAMTPDQKKATMHIIANRDSVCGIQGNAGTGKTCMLQAVQSIAVAEGYEVIGFSHAASAVFELQQEACIDAQTVTSFLQRDAMEQRSDKQLWVIDEASMLSSRDLANMLKRARQENAKVVLVGDVKQIPSVGAGRMFGELQDRGVVSTVEMRQIVRQKGRDYRESARELSERKVDAAMNRLEQKGRIVEIENTVARRTAIVKECLDGDYRKSMVVTSNNHDRRELNRAIRERLKTDGWISEEQRLFTVRTAKNISGEARHYAQSYQPGDVVFAQVPGIIGRAGGSGRVVETDCHSNRVTVISKTGAELSIDVRKHGDRLAVYADHELVFAKGDRVIFCKNDRGLDLKNGQMGIVRNIDDRGNITFKFDQGRELKVNLSSQYNYIDHAYAITDYKSQGKTADRVIYHAVAKDANFSRAYVSITRGKTSVSVYTDSSSELRKRIKEEYLKETALDDRVAWSDKSSIDGRFGSQYGRTESQLELTSELALEVDSDHVCELRDAMGQAQSDLDDSIMLDSQEQMLGNDEIAIGVGVDSPDGAELCDDGLELDGLER